MDRPSIFPLKYPELKYSELTTAMGDSEEGFASPYRSLKMLGVFPDLGPNSRPCPESAMRVDYLRNYFRSVHTKPVIVDFRDAGFIAYSDDVGLFCEGGSRPVYRWRDGGICCVFRGHLDYFEENKRPGDETDLITSMYKAQTVGNFSFKIPSPLDGYYHCILFDHRDDAVRKVMAISRIHVDPTDQVQHLHFGFDAYGCCIISDDIEIMAEVCGSSFKAIENHGWYHSSLQLNPEEFAGGSGS